MTMVGRVGLIGILCAGCFLAACSGRPGSGSSGLTDDVDASDLSDSDAGPTDVTDGSGDIGDAEADGADVVDAPARDCIDCHGSEDNAAPPLDTQGNDDRTLRSVGAHQIHLIGGLVAAGIDCSECHVVPEDGDTEHADELPAELTWGGLATHRDSIPIWDTESFTCAGVYCHGATLGGGVLTEPTWTALDGAATECGACHGTPPPAPHPERESCFDCHPDTVDEERRLNTETHIDGIVQVEADTCSSCHGNDDNAAPPVALDLSSDRASIGVGAHQAHLDEGPFRVAIDCEECHLVPADVYSPGHFDDSPAAEVIFGPLAAHDESSPSWDRETRRCTDSYCHGATLTGGMNTEPVWTATEGTQANCGSCHGLPPRQPHVQRPDCPTCHTQTLDADFNLDLTFHIDGELQVAIGCNSCHGSEDNAAPPLDTAGNTESTFVSVGAHQRHVTDSVLRRALPCDECHDEPENIGDEGHIDDPPAEVVFGTLATTDDLDPTWDRDQTRCSDTYCHGASIGGGFNTDPLWTAPPDTQVWCGACHSLPPPAPHPTANACFICHSETIGPDFEINIDLHINGLIEVSDDLECGSCHAVPPDSGTHRLHFGADASEAEYGGTSSATEIRPDGEVYAFECGNCHPTNPDAHLNGATNAAGGHAEIDLSPTGAPPGSLKALNPPTATYIPGDERLVDADGLYYTLGTCSDVYCHSEIVVSATPDGVPLPGLDFPFIDFPIEYPDFEVVRERVYRSPIWGTTELSCDGCHGFPPRIFEDDGVQAGAGDSHSFIDADGYETLHGWAMGAAEPIACATCHNDTVADPGTRGRTSEGEARAWGFWEPIEIFDRTRHVNGRPDVRFTADPVRLIRSDFELDDAAYDPETRSCTNISCHLEQDEVEWGAPYRPDTLECNVCHRM